MSEKKNTTNDEVKEETAAAAKAAEDAAAADAKAAEDAAAKAAEETAGDAKETTAATSASDTTAKKDADATKDAPAPCAKQPKKAKGRKKQIVIGVVAVLVVICVGVGVWHDQPSFCNAICHTPMDGYLTTYEATPGQPAKDKWDNEVSDASAMMAPVHAKEGVSCVGCHVPTIGEQVSEGLSWVSGNYGVIQTNNLHFVPEEKGLSELTHARGIASEQFCLNSGCHTTSSGAAMTRDDLVEKTSYMKYNVHTQPHGDVACSDCHKAHRASTVTCNQCHTEATLPEGWISPTEAEALEPVAVN